MWLNKFILLVVNKMVDLYSFAHKKDSRQRDKNAVVVDQVAKEESRDAWLLTHYICKIRCVI
jgi:hypothetical protein